ncbi:MAG: hypothetical protein WBM43_10590 [Flavobacteriaceae bacterium]
MKSISRYFLLALLFIAPQQGWSQEDYQQEIKQLKEQRELVETEERDALKNELEAINQQLEEGEITAEEAKTRKAAVAEKRALNIEDRKSIIDNKIALLERNKGAVTPEEGDANIWEDGVEVTVNIGDETWEPFDSKKYPKYDRRTFSNFIIAFGLNNAIPEGGNLNDSPYSAWRSRYFELGWAWRTRVFSHSNFMRFHYGFSFTFNGLRNNSNLYYTTDENNQVVREVFPVNLDKSKLRTDNFIIPLHLEFGPTKKTVTETRVRYSIKRQLRIGLGGYGGVNMGTRQKLKYRVDGNRIKEKSANIFDSNQFVYGLSGWIGVGCVQFNVRYDLQTILKNTEVLEKNILFGVRFEI